MEGGLVIEVVGLQVGILQLQVLPLLVHVLQHVVDRAHDGGEVCL
jgi:hypothetical protein